MTLAKHVFLGQGDARRVRSVVESAEQARRAPGPGTGVEASSGAGQSRLAKGGASSSEPNTSTEPSQAS